MDAKYLNLKLIIGITYLTILSVGLFFLFSAIDLKDLTSYEFIRSNKDIILKYKNENFFYLTCIFFLFCVRAVYKGNETPTPKGWVVGVCPTNRCPHFGYL